MFARRGVSALRPSAGMTIIEVLMALAVVVIAAGHLVHLQTSTIRKSGELRTRSLAQAAAVRKAEELKAAPIEAIEQWAGGQAREVALDLAGKGRPGRTGLWHAEVREAPGGVEAFEIRSIVEWAPSEGSEPRRVEHVAYIFR